MKIDQNVIKTTEDITRETVLKSLRSEYSSDIVNTLKLWQSEPEDREMMRISAEAVVWKIKYLSNIELVLRSKETINWDK